MKNKCFLLKYAFGIALSATLLIFQGCKDDDVYVRNYIEVSDDGYTFRASGGELTLNVNPTPSGSWTAQIQSGGEWLTEVSQDVSTYTVSATSNISSDADTRSAKILFKSGEATREITIYQDAIIEGYKLDENGVAPRLVKIPTDLTSIVISSNGKYIGAVGDYIDERTDMYYYYPVIFETSNPDREDWTVLPENYNYAWEAKGIADNGELLVDSWSPSYSAYHCLPDGTMNPVSGFRTVQFSGISADAAIWVGYVTQDGNDTPWKTSPVKWVNGVAEILPVPELNLWGEVAFNGQHARGLSADGSIIYGDDWGNNDLEFCAVYWDENDVYHIFGEDLVEFGEEVLNEGTEWEFRIPWAKHVRQTATSTNLSGNGKYYTSGFWDLDVVNFVASTEYMYPYIYNMETGEDRVLYEYPDHAGLSASDEGLISIGFPSAGTVQGFIYDFEADTEPIPANKYIMDTYGINLGKDIIIEKFCSDSKTILGRIVLGTSMMGSIISEYFYIYYPDRE